ncbi:hypothetical protein OESDEN_24095 [Oesophagostomum dentatum]|uniref:Uncharacterized protein n=1 Tax=Oesophagostomum dentatum TaxID=61180 RepID=A0A0B1RZA5_OESDE|nr:hypothetical protein OESDEN_24095 [Oesophagostomum dentatum]
MPLSKLLALLSELRSLAYDCNLEDLAHICSVSTDKCDKEKGGLHARVVSYRRRHWQSNVNLPQLIQEAMRDGIWKMESNEDFFGCYYQPGGIGQLIGLTCAFA